MADPLGFEMRTAERFGWDLAGRGFRWACQLEWRLLVDAARHGFPVDPPPRPDPCDDPAEWREAICACRWVTDIESLIGWLADGAP